MAAPQSIGGPPIMGASHNIGAPGNLGLQTNMRGRDNHEGLGNAMNQRNMGQQSDIRDQRNTRNFEGYPGDQGNRGGPATNDPTNMNNPGHPMSLRGQENMGRLNNMEGPGNIRAQGPGPLRPPSHMGDHRNMGGYDRPNVRGARMGSQDSHSSQGSRHMAGEEETFGRGQNMRQVSGTEGSSAGNHSMERSRFTGESMENMSGQTSGPSRVGGFDRLQEERSTSLKNEMQNSMRAPIDMGRPGRNEALTRSGGPNSIYGGQSSFESQSSGSMGGPGSVRERDMMNGPDARPGYSGGDGNDLDMEYDNFGGPGQEYDQGITQEGVKRGLNRETARSMAALNQRPPEASQRAGPVGGGLTHSQSSSDMRPVGQVGGGMSRQGGRVNIFREALKGAASNKAMEGREESGSRHDMAANYDSRGNPSAQPEGAVGSRRDESRQWGGEKDQRPYSPSQEEGGYGRREVQRGRGRGKEDYTEEEYEPYDNYGRRGERGSSSSRQGEWGGREGYSSGGRSSQPRSQPAEQSRWPGQRYSISNSLYKNNIFSRNTSRGPVESRKSAGDRRMERLEIVKNPFDPSLKAESSAASSRINTDSSTIPGMNPPAPEPSSSGKSRGAEEGSEGPSESGPDYAALLQYLQYYQKQLGPDEGGK